MSKATIYLSLKNDKLEYRDSEKHSGKSIATKVKPGTKVIWTLDKKSGIKDISGMNIVSSGRFFSKGPFKKSGNKWQARVSRKAKGEADYEMFIVPENSTTKKSSVTLKTVRESSDGNPSKIIIRV